MPLKEYAGPGVVMSVVTDHELLEGSFSLVFIGGMLGVDRGNWFKSSGPIIFVCCRNFAASLSSPLENILRSSNQEQCTVRCLDLV